MFKAAKFFSQKHSFSDLSSSFETHVLSGTFHFVNFAADNSDISGTSENIVSWKERIREGKRGKGEDKRKRWRMGGK